jgi:hypothetical protein
MYRRLTLFISVCPDNASCSLLRTENGPLRGQLVKKNFPHTFPSIPVANAVFGRKRRAPYNRVVGTFVEERFTNGPAAVASPRINAQFDSEPDSFAEKNQPRRRTGQILRDFRDSAVPFLKSQNSKEHDAGAISCPPM